MLKRLIRKRSTAHVDFCDSCGQVCTSACRAQASRDRLKAALPQGPFRGAL
jgi:hypothetical protein